MGRLRIALPKGRMFDPAVEILRKVGLVNRELDDDSRKLVLPDEKNDVEFILSKAVDVQTYVEHGVADLGVAGKDILLESEADVYEVADLGFGECRLVVALSKQAGITSLEELPLTSRVATKYTNVAEKFFTKRGFQVELVKLNGSIELAPLIGLVDMIVDISSTGTTLKKNNLVEIGEIAKSSARLIVNRVSYKTEDQRIIKIIKQVKEVVKE
ncbi:ATP phosphoribosyltransferase [Halobacteroides halobius DSM 5150]|uniref:ATP phosphoribosyltransferase n=1 Tax=Halobacteroides halobius (strain ATCC 35273 / DSM 5150 / MD-1) TaxID=748449 RepID=L0K8T3_HALHC|nr:ATP phosphoribosyltransferase [Halobacteroides halobius]AGB40950.1 ATP phosphoribosyltransferase [Halobacteroides halobius DSM 5150]